MRLNDIIDRIKLPFRKEKELFSSLRDIMGFYPHNIEHYKVALTHKSSGQRNDKGKPLNNERLEFLGDALLDAVVGHIVYEHFSGKREGFLTNTRSKLVSRETLGKLAQEMGLTELIQSNGSQRSHNSYMAGNAFEALVGAIYLDQGYDAVMRFMKKRILKQMVNIDKVAYKEVNFKSKLLEWTQKNRVKMEFRMLKQSKDSQGSPVFGFQVVRRHCSACAANPSSSMPSSCRSLSGRRWRKSLRWQLPTWSRKTTSSFRRKSRSTRLKPLSAHVVSPRRRRSRRRPSRWSRRLTSWISPTSPTRRLSRAAKILLPLLRLLPSASKTSPKM